MSEIIGKINTNLKPGKYIRELVKRIKVDKIREVKVGEIVTIALPYDRDYSIAYVGNKPEKYSCQDDILTIVMTECALVYRYSDGGKSKLEVVVAR